MTARGARPDDYPHFVRFFAELGVDDPVPGAEKWAASCAHAIMVEDDGRVVGYGHVRPLRESAHVVHVVAAPEARGRGVGSLIMRELAARLRSAGCRQWYLNVKPDNLPAVRLYERFGMRPAYRSVALRFPWTGLDQLPGCLGREIEADDAVYGLPAGTLDNVRSRAYVVVTLDGGVAAFDPAFPGAYPFRAFRPEIARALLERLRPHARHDFLNLMVENDPPLAELLIAAGASIRLEILRMEGEIPG